MDKQPKDIIHMILEYCEPIDYVRCLQASKFFHPVNQSQYQRKIQALAQKLKDQKVAETKLYLSIFGTLGEMLGPKIGLDLRGFNEHLMKNAESYADLFEELSKNYKRYD